MLKTLEITGFKSFGKKIVVTIDSSITAVVGPNGSGKSNVVESIRFVLGEQSMKSLRGKGSTDLLFKGSKGLSAANKLRVAITFDNKKRLLTLANDGGKNISLDFDNVTVARELYADGKSIYSVNGTEVRLKDVTDLLASVHIGASGHHIISQGEADRLLSSSPRERRSMIDDALGLRVYELRIRDAERKLEKAKINISEVEAARRELLPHLKFLEKQVQKLSEAEEARKELSIRYYKYENASYGILNKKEEDIRKEIFNIENEILTHGIDTNTDDVVEYDNSQIFVLKEAIEKIQIEKSALLRTRENLERSLGRTEGLVEALQTPKKKPIVTSEIVHISKDEFTTFCDHLADEIDALVANPDTDKYTWVDSLKNLSHRVKEFLNKYRIHKDIGEDIDTDNSEELSAAIAMQEDLKNQIEQNIASINILEKDEHLQRANLLDEESKMRSFESENYKKRVERVRLNAEKQNRENELERILGDIMLLREEYKIFEPFLVHSLNSEDKLSDATKEILQSERRSLERLRMKLEELGGGSGDEITKEFDNAKERDEYLAKELTDLHQSMQSLLGLIGELRDTVRKEFSRGIDKINSEFSNFFKAMFGGGNAFLSLVAEMRKEKTLSLEEIEEGLEIEDLSAQAGETTLPKFERGVDIHVDLPNKKVKELNMLSGGERSLVSIALLFAMSQVNPPPFLVLDETDAALDEANSRRYGDMLERLSSSTQLLVVTHNRETMSRAGTIYGVTMGSDAVSKLLSIEFGDAVKVAK